jgi:hypothetical protein
MKKLEHKFGDDGLFWMSYEDLLKRFDLLDRTRLFDRDWTVVQQWTSVSVAWVTGYLNTKFSVEIKKAGPTVFVLCQVRLMIRHEKPHANEISSTTDTSAASKANIASISTLYYRRRMQNLATTLSGPVGPGLAIEAFLLRLT